jgi:hypothetical protein
MITERGDLILAPMAAARRGYRPVPWAFSIARDVQDSSVIPFNLLKEVECLTWIFGLQVI